MKSLTFYILIIFALIACKKYDKEPKEWKDVSLTYKDIHLSCVEMINENVGFIGGTVENDSNALLIYNAYPFPFASAYYNLEPNEEFFQSSKTPCLYKTTDAGKNWTGLSTPFKSYIRQIHFLNQDTGFVSTQHEGAYKTYNGGDTWSRILGRLVFPYDYLDGYSAMDSFGFIDNVYEFQLAFINGKVGYASTSVWPKFVIKTTDGGQTWQRTTILDGTIYFPFQDEYGFLIHDRSQIYITTNGGNDWEFWCEFDYIDDIQFVSKDSIFVLDNGTLRKTTDAGQNWIEINPGTNISNFEVVENNDTYATDWFNIYNLCDYNPPSMTRERPGQIWGFCFPSSHLGIAVGSKGMILRYTGED